MGEPGPYDPRSRAIFAGEAGNASESQGGQSGHKVGAMQGR